jgi:luciferase family oxidoreductase group 1
MKYSLLDLSPVPEGSTTAEAIANTLDLARHAEACGYHRYWLAEHHSMPGIASAATSVLIGQVAGVTRTMRIGAGGIMLPNHAPLAIAEQFGTLAEIFPGRIDLGLGRAPGGDSAVARALRRRLEREDDFPRDVVELMRYLGPARTDGAVRAIPGEGTRVPLWILGSSLYGAQLAAHLGLPYAFASHFAPAMLDPAITIYRSHFQPSDQCGAPYFMLAVNVFAAESDADGAYLRTSMQQAFANLRIGQPGKLPTPVRDPEAVIPAHVRPMVDEALKVAAAGSPRTVRDQLREMIDYFGPDEVILTGQIHDHGARLRSFEIAAEVMSELQETAAA